MSEQGESDTPGPLARKLTALLSGKVHEETGSPLSDRDIVEQIEAHVKTLGLPEEERKRREISRTYLWQLKTGRRDNPSKLHLQTLAAYCKVPVSYLLDDTTTSADDQKYLFGAMTEDERDVAMRARGVSDRGLAAIRSMAEHVRALEGLPPDPVSPAPDARQG